MQSMGAQKIRADSTLRRADRDIVAAGIMIAATILFVGTGGSLFPQIVESMLGNKTQPTNALSTAVLLNIALLIFGYRRYRELTGEVSERRKAEDQARLLAEIDPLTACYNRRSLGPATEQLLRQAKAKGEAVAVLMIDLDNFKQINDMYGHAAGDTILRETARRVMDLMPTGARVARFGGDEFACAVPFDPRRDDRIDAIAAGLIEAVSKPVLLAGTPVEVTVSIGLSSTARSTDVADESALLHLADIAMYHAKKHGRNRYAWFEPEMENEIRIRGELATGIRKGVAAGEFVPYYEKQIDLASGEIVGFEMLARWNSPVLGVISPEVFIPVAEELGLIGQLSEQIIAQALLDARQWDPRLTLSVNISPVQMRDPWFAQKLLRMLVEANFPASRLEIEITESCFHEDMGLVRSLVSSLKNQGIKISLDDFGTGYSSLSQLQALPFDSIKIDRSFVTNLMTNHDSATIVQAITALGAGLNLPITAEGIETSDVLQELQKLGKFKGQGYLYGQPQAAAATLQELTACNLAMPALPAPAEPTLAVIEELAARRA
jgi:diguanylate cyclase (GGDEF)-like protein